MQSQPEIIDWRILNIAITYVFYERTKSSFGIKQLWMPEWKYLDVGLVSLSHDSEFCWNRKKRSLKYQMS